MNKLHNDIFHEKLMKGSPADAKIAVNAVHTQMLTLLFPDQR